MGMLRGIGNTLVIADPGGRRIGSGGSTVQCLLQVLSLEMRGRRTTGMVRDPEGITKILDDLRILIVHAGGDSRRMPPYGPCGKLFVPIPGDAGGALGTTLFDSLIPAYLGLPLPSSGGGQVVVASGDVLLDFDADGIVFAEEGVTGVGAFAQPEIARNHGVYCPEDNGRVRRFLQKPSVSGQKAAGAVGPHGQTVLDIGILNFSPRSAVRLLGICGAVPLRDRKPGLARRGPFAKELEITGFDIYREICCALGSDTRLRGYIDEVGAAGSRLTKTALESLFRGLRSIPFHVHVVPRLRFLHFGTLQDLIISGRSLRGSGRSDAEEDACIVVDSYVDNEEAICGKDAWIEGCRIGAPLALGGNNVVVGVDIAAPLKLPRDGCLDIIAGKRRGGRRGWFVRIYATGDAFHLRADGGARLCGLPVLEWLKAMDASPTDAWGTEMPAEARTVWNGRLFPHVREHSGYRDWLFLLEPEKSSAAQKAAWVTAEKYSLAEIALAADLDAFQSRRLTIRGDVVRESLAEHLWPESGLSAKEIVYLAGHGGKNDPMRWVLALLREAVSSYGAARKRPGPETFELTRVLHTLGTVVAQIAGGGQKNWPKLGDELPPALKTGLTVQEKGALREMGVPVAGADQPAAWAAAIKEAAFLNLGRAIVRRSGRIPTPPINALRSDEIVWGRAPARLDLGGGWTDTPPYSLERGGCVINAAVDLNGQAPIHAYARVIERPEIHINSIDHSTRIVVSTLGDLMDYRKPGSQFALAKAALALSGFSPAAAAWPAGVKTLGGMLGHFGGGIELTTLAAIPSGSGLGTSSIMGAVLMSVIGRLTGQSMAQRELFHTVLKLEQELTTGGGWQDQVGGAVEGLKLITTEKGLVPDPTIRFIPADLLDPSLNGGRTLLYYTGLRRLAKSILHEVVGRYLDRDRAAMETLRRLHAFPPLMADAMSRRDIGRFGELIDVAWKLNVALDPDHTTPVVEDLQARIKPYVFGAKLLGAGGGGFLLMVCKSPEDAGIVREMLRKCPPNDKARFFDYSVSKSGLVITVC